MKNTYTIVILLGGSLALFLYYIAIPYERKFKYWDSIAIDFKKYKFFLSKTSAYRRVFSFFTFISYVIKIIGIITTAFLLYSTIAGSFNNKLLIISSVCDSLGLLFPFQKYVDAFSYCTVVMEEAILACRTSDSDEMVYERLYSKYIECEKYLHIELKI